MLGVHFVAVLLLSGVVGSQSVVPQAPFAYREYALGTSVAAVVTISGVRGTEPRTLHERPAKIEELEWRVPYGESRSGSVDPVRDVRFSFYDDQLYQIVVTYDRDRTEGLTSEDIIESLSASYGLPLLSQRKLGPVAKPSGVPAETVTLAQWEDPATILLLTRGTYQPQYQLVLISKALQPRARIAIKEALRLDAHEAPQREVDRRQQAAWDATLAGQKARVINRAAFRP